MEIAVIARWGKPSLETYEKAYEGFKQAFELYEELKREGKITSYEVYGFDTGDREIEAGFVIIKGPEQWIHQLPQDPRVAELMTRTTLVSSHFSMDFLVFGEALLNRVELGRRVAKDLQLVPVG